MFWNFFKLRKSSEITHVVFIKGEEIMTELGRRGTDIGPDLEGGDQNTDQGHGLDHAPKGRFQGISSCL